MNDFSDETVLVWERSGGGLGGLYLFSSPPVGRGMRLDASAPYVEGCGCAGLAAQRSCRALVAEVEQWCVGTATTSSTGSVALWTHEGSLRAPRPRIRADGRLQFVRKHLSRD